MAVLSAVKITNYPNEQFVVVPGYDSLIVPYYGHDSELSSKLTTSEITVHIDDGNNYPIGNGHVCRFWDKLYYIENVSGSPYLGYDLVVIDDVRYRVRGYSMEMYINPAPDFSSMDTIRYYECDHDGHGDNDDLVKFDVVGYAGYFVLPSDNKLSKNNPVCDGKRILLTQFKWIIVNTNDTRYDCHHIYRKILVNGMPGEI